MCIFLLWFLKLAFLINASSQHSDDANLNNVTKCCPIDHTIQITNKTIKCVPNHTHGSHWESYKVNVSQKKGHIILENDNISLIIEPNGNLRVVDGKKTNFYDDYCVDFDQDDIFMAVIHNKTIPSLEVPVIQSIRKCCPLDETVEQKGLLTKCISSHTHSAHWKNLNVEVSMARGRIISETDAVGLFVFNNGTLMVQDSEANSTDYYYHYCVDHNQNNTYIAILRAHVTEPIVSFNSLLLEKTIQNLTTQPHIAYVYLKFLSYIGVTIAGIVIIYFIGSISKNPVIYLGFSCLFFIFGFVISEFQMSFFSQNMSDSCYLLAFILLQDSNEGVQVRSTTRQSNFMQIYFLFTTIALICSMEFVQLTHVFPSSVILTFEIIQYFSNHLIYLDMKLSKSSNSLSFYEKIKTSQRTIIIISIFIILGVIETYLNTFFGSSDYIPIFQRFYLCLVGYLVVLYMYRHKQETANSEIQLESGFEMRQLFPANIVDTSDETIMETFEQVETINLN